MVSKVTIGLFVAGFFGAAFLITGGVLVDVFPGIIRKLIDDQVVLKPNSSTYNMWEEPTAPIYFQVWMFDIINPEEILAGEKPVVKQIGPYSYREKRKKVNITFHENGTVRYRELRSFFFDPEMSAGKESDSFITLNIPMLTLLDMVRYISPLKKDAVKALIKVEKENFFMNLTVSDLMWGYHDPIFDIINKITKLFHLNLTVPEEFGLFYDGNGTDDGWYEIFTGENDVDRFGEIVTWNGRPNLTMWTSDLANSINGSDGTIYPPNINKGDTKYLFSSDLCRSLGMDFTEGVNHKGIDMDRFVAPKFLFGNVTINPYNAGFCTPAGHCLPSGLLNASVCRQGAPVVMSMPHFLGCDPETINSIIGLHPNQAEHQSFIDVEPMTGVVMNAGKRLQINVYIDKVDGFGVTDNLNATFLPIMWLNESALIDDKDADDFKSEVYGKLTLTVAIKYGLIALGGFMLLVIIIIVGVRGYRRRSKDGRSLNVNSPDKSLLISNGSVHI